MNRAVVALGSNIDPDKHIPQALERLADQFPFLAQSAIVETEPIGPPNQPNYLNGAVLIETSLSCEELKHRLLAIESELGRVRKGADKYGPRTIDLDIVLWNDTLVDDDVLTRDFLRNAVREVRPDLSVDSLGRDPDQ